MITHKRTIWVKKDKSYLDAIDMSNDYPYTYDVGKKTNKLPV
jgi:hypothetical protein